MNLYSIRAAQLFLMSCFLTLLFVSTDTCAQKTVHPMRYHVGPKDPAAHLVEVMLATEGWDLDTLDFKLPNWTPGYYQLMNYSEKVSNFKVSDTSGKSIPFQKLNSNTWRIVVPQGIKLTITYSVLADRKFVATSFLDESHMYLVPASLFLYVDWTP